MAEKWDKDTTPSEKLLTLFSILFFNDREFSLTELTSESRLNASKPTVSRLIRQLMDSKIINIQRIQRGKEAFYRMIRTQRLPAVSMNAEGLYQLALCREFLTGLLPKSMLQEIQMSLYQATTCLPQESQGLPKNIGGRLSKGRIDYTPFQRILDTLINAIREAKVCSVSYRSALGKEEKSYDFAPKRILAFRESLYVEGYIVSDKGAVVPLYDDMSRLAVHRMKECILTRRSSEKISDVPRQDDSVMGVMLGSGSFTAIIHFAPEVATYVSERLWSDDQKIEVHDDGSITLHVQISNIPECISWIMSFSDKAEIIGPEELRNAVKDTFSRMYKIYHPDGSVCS